MQPIEQFSAEELDTLELQSFRGIEQAQSQLQGFQQNIVVIRQERKKREETKKVEKIGKK